MGHSPKFQEFLRLIEYDLDEAAIDSLVDDFNIKEWKEWLDYKKSNKVKPDVIFIQKKEPEDEKTVLAKLEVPFEEDPWPFTGDISKEPIFENIQKKGTSRCHRTLQESSGEGSLYYEVGRYHLNLNNNYTSAASCYGYNTNQCYEGS